MSAGAGIVAVTFGLARYGYGLLLPDLRAALQLDSAALGFIATGSFAAYLAATVAHELPARARGRALAIISSGTGWGVLVSVPIALAAGASWRTAWIVFAALALLATLWAGRVLRGVGAPGSAERLRMSWFVCPRSGPLLAGALLVGLGSSVYWTFAVDLVAGEGAMSTSAARLVLAVVGAASLIGAFSGDLVERIGARPTMAAGALALAASLVLIAIAPGSWLAVAPSALLFGAAYNVLIAVDAIWSARVFAGRPATGLAAVMFMLATGLLAGPAIAGVAATSFGLPAAFLGGALVVAATVFLIPREELRQRPALSPAAGG